MKTLSNCIPLLVLIALLPFLIGLLPTFELYGRYWGGGPLMESVINWVASWAPWHIAQPLVMHFEASGSFWVYFPVALLLSTCFLLTGYGLCEGLLYAVNRSHIRQFDKQRKIVKEI